MREPPHAGRAAARARPRSAAARSGDRRRSSCRPAGEARRARISKRATRKTTTKRMARRASPRCCRRPSWPSASPARRVPWRSRLFSRRLPPGAGRQPAVHMAAPAPVAQPVRTAAATPEALGWVKGPDPVRSRRGSRISRSRRPSPCPAAAAAAPAPRAKEATQIARNDDAPTIDDAPPRAAAHERLDHPDRRYRRRRARPTIS